MSDTTSADHDRQRHRDGVFFEDWSEWRSLGGWPQYTRHPVGQRPTNMPAYYCRLEESSTLIGGPAFEVSIPLDIRCHHILKSVKGAVMIPRRRGSKAVDIWLVPADQWPEMRAALPLIKQIISGMCAQR
ncbi:hypothetical protein [Ancylobacter radicis]|uniref:Uncharacterized protein n=1 Tax=Ancylobacter radicis TaxID=2836179 RepID=A0ABS5R3N7_9HYPH|nr:hypothetical protein [Ancylobacter radicis]MBS9476259.1 hypothetical protein [Ancylobacter radicis]